MKLAKNFYKGVENSKLNTVNDFLGYEFKHHDALYDALACSNILNNISVELNCRDIDEISRLLGVTIGTVDSNGYTPSSTKGKVIKISNRISSSKRENRVKNLNKTAFKNEVVVFTGKLNSMSRDEAMKIVKNLGGSSGSSVTKSTTILVTNMKDIESLTRAEMSTKLRRATDLNKFGQRIKIIDEEKFLSMCR